MIGIGARVAAGPGGHPWLGLLFWVGLVLCLVGGLPAVVRPTRITGTGPDARASLRRRFGLAAAGMSAMAVFLIWLAINESSTVRVIAYAGAALAAASAALFGIAFALFRVRPD